MDHSTLRTLAGESLRIDSDELARLEAGLRGAVVRPGDPGYDEARAVNNGMHDRRPALVVRAAGVADVMATVRFARERELLLAVRGGGHSAPGFGTCDGGIVLDLGLMKGIRVDPESRTVRAEGGCTWGDLDHATHAFGLATPGGIVSTTGIAGLTLGGGMGHLGRRFGLSCDNLLGADVVTADGELVSCSEEREKDLFWAIRGGGGNFGVATSFEFRLHPVSHVVGGPMVFRLEADFLRRYRSFLREAPEALGAVLNLTPAPPAPFVPEAWHGRPVAAVVACWSGAEEEAPEVLGALRQCGRLVADGVECLPYPAINQLFDELMRPGLQQYWKGSFARELTDDAIAVHVEHAAKVPSPESGFLLVPIDGACQRVPRESTAFPRRDVAFSGIVSGAWPDPADNERNIRWVRDYHEALRPHAEAEGYVNFMSGDDADRVRVNYGPSYERLVEVKTRFDPINLFRLNQNIEPLAR